MSIVTLLWWICVTAVLILPAVSYTGYPPTSAEYILALAACVLLGTAGAFASSRLRFLGVALLLTLTALTIVVYFGGYFTHNSWLKAASVLVGTSFAALSWKNLAAALQVAGITAFAQILTAAIATSPMVIKLEERQTAKSDRPSIVHLILDEHAGTGAFPADAVSTSAVTAFETAYVSKGFIVFRRAYTKDGSTEISIGRLLNPGIKKPENLISSHMRTFSLGSSTAFDKVAKKRAMDITHTRYMDLSPSIQGKSNIARHLVYDTNVAYGAIREHGVLFRERCIIFGALLFNWYSRGADSPRLQNFLNAMEAWRRLNGVLDPISRVHPLVSRSILSQLSSRLINSGERGTYYFAHLIYPHYPYVFDHAGNLRPVGEWLNRTVTVLGTSNNLDTRRQRYQLHFEQASCAAGDVFELVAGLKKRPAMADAVVFIHGDHGSRIEIPAHETFVSAGYDESHLDRDWRGTFVAVKIPGLRGRIIDEPVRLDTIYANLLKNEFMGLDLEQLRPQADSPYQNWQHQVQ